MNGSEVVVTGMGAIAPNGVGLPRFWEAVREGVSGVSRLERFDVDEFPVTFAATVDGYDPSDHFSRREANRMDKFVQFGVIAAEEAIEHAGYDRDDPEYDPYRTGVLIGSGIGGLSTIEEQHKNFLDRGPKRISPFLIPKLIINMASGQVAIRNDCRGPNKSVVTACASSGHALGDSARMIQRGDADVMVTGGAEFGITPLGFGGFCSIKALSTRNDDPQAASRPFDAERDGFVMGEGAACVVLESREHAEQRGATIYARLAGYGQTCDAHHITAPREDAEGAVRCMELALEDGEIDPDRVDYINAHGTSTPLNDKTETLAIRSVFGDHADRLKISSTKSTTGHLLGAAGALESIVSIMSIDRGVIPPTINYEHEDPDCDLDYVPNTPQEVDVDVALSNTFGFGGHNATLAFVAP